MSKDRFVIVAEGGENIIGVFKSTKEAQAYIDEEADWEYRDTMSIMPLTNPCWFNKPTTNQ